MYHTHTLLLLSIERGGARTSERERRGRERERREEREERGERGDQTAYPECHKNPSPFLMRPNNNRANKQEVRNMPP